MYDELVGRLREPCQYENCILCQQAADAIEELQQQVEHYHGCMNDWFEAAQEYEAAVPKWIPVTERLPDTMKDKSVYSGWSAEIAPSYDVLCYLGSEKRQTVAWYSHTYNEWTTVDENTVYCFGEVTHWMPLPQPPKEE